MDADEIAEELYAGPREEFVPTRDRRARAAQVHGEHEVAEAIRALPKPTTAAWLVNLVVRRHRQDVVRLLELGAALRRAYQQRDGDQLRELVRQRHDVLRQLTRDARAVARAEGRGLTGPVADQVQNTFQAALSDPSIGDEVRAGRLAAAAKVPATVGWPEPPPDAAPPRAKSKADSPRTTTSRAGAGTAGPRNGGAVGSRSRAPAGSSSSAPPGRPSTTQRANRQTRDELARRRAEKAEARRRAAEARERAEQTTRACEEAERDLAQAQEKADQAGERVEQARAELDRARHAERASKEQVKTARSAVTAARRAANVAQRALDEQQ
ncbi:MAG TPA: hypothetical protein VG756_06265 [Pseudonocardiaceae bacterium]|nr:hypothetical protein [Pseudonocardiaceae bacterium]